MATISKFLGKSARWPPFQKFLNIQDGARCEEKSRFQKSVFSKTLKMVLIVELLYSDMYFGLYSVKHPGISVMMEDFKCVLDYQLGKIVCIKITMPALEDPSCDPVHLEMNFSAESGSIYSILAGVEKHFKMIPVLYPEKVVFVKITMPGYERCPQGEIEDMSESGPEPLLENW